MKKTKTIYPLKTKRLFLFRQPQQTYSKSSTDPTTTVVTLTTFPPLQGAGSSRAARTGGREAGIDHLEE